jgi:hypothetical protein
MDLSAFCAIAPASFMWRIAVCLSFRTTIEHSTRLSHSLCYCPAGNSRLRKIDTKQPTPTVHTVLGGGNNSKLTLDGPRYLCFDSKSKESVIYMTCEGGTIKRWDSKAGSNPPNERVEGRKYWYVLTFATRQVP